MLKPRPSPLCAGLLALLLHGCAGNPAVARPLPPAQAAFASDIAQRHGLDAERIRQWLAQAEVQEGILAAMRRPAEAKPWYDYRPIFLTESRIAGGVDFWQEHRELLDRVSRDYGVDPEYIVAIIGVETRYGGFTGRNRVLDALVTLAFHYPPRAEFFRSELEHFFQLVEEEDIDPVRTTGSYAGAMGWGQFIPSSYRHYTRDFDGDGRRDLWNSPGDILASVANYLKEHGWQSGAPVVEALSAPPDNLDDWRSLGYKPARPAAALRADGAVLGNSLDASTPVGLVELEVAPQRHQQWATLNNFYVITRYNRSPLYAMAVTELAAEIRARMQDHAPL